MRLLYTALFTLLLPLILLRLWWRGRRLPGYRRDLAQRFGHLTLPNDHRPLVWVHAVSVGETIAARPVVERLLACGDLRVLITTMTPTGAERARAAFPASEYGQRVVHAYVPYDIPLFLGRFLARTRPALTLIMETELWPNTIHACYQRKIPVLLLNARLSERSARGYRRISGLTRKTLRSLSAVAVQNEDDAARFRRLGLAEEHCHVTGSIKFDLTLDDSLREQARELKTHYSGGGERVVWIAASTHSGEEESVLAAHRQLKERFPRLLLVLVPRHPDRFEQVAALCDSLSLTVLRRSCGDRPTSQTDIVLGDTMGEMLLLYGASDIAFVGGSLVATGGHNLIEPAAWGLPLVIGPHMFNFAEVARLMIDAGGVAQVRDERELASAVETLAKDEKLRVARGEACLHVANANRGALDRVEQLLHPYLPQ